MEKDRTRDAAQTQLPRWDGPLTHPFYSKVLKRCLDFALAVVFLLPCLAVMLPIAIAVKCTSEGPVFYRALYHNRPFSILKFRTMVVGADQYASTTALDDPRVTRVGRMLRRSKLDELPQLFNILKGEMSFIGPRPELLRYTMRYTPQEQCILWVRPGISDPSSIRLINLDELVGHDDPEGCYETKILAEKKIPRPSVYRYENDGVIIQKTDITDRYSWATKTIVGMLENEVYLGHTVNYKTTTLSYKDRKKKVYFILLHQDLIVIV